MIDPIPQIVARLEGLTLSVDPQKKLHKLVSAMTPSNRGFIVQYTKYNPPIDLAGSIQEINLSVLLYHQDLNSWATCQKQIVNDINDVCRSISCQASNEFSGFQLWYESEGTIKLNQETNFFESEIPLRISEIQGV
jgi:hypothetical protein